MTKSLAGDFLFTYYGYNGNHQPQLILADESGAFIYLEPRGKILTLCFDTTQRRCIGWHDLATGESYPCPDTAKTAAEYDQCRHCQQKTGFNPAFYNALSISKQQVARNQQPHNLYLAHFGPNVVKVGISWAERGIRRLLDQGARSGLIIKTFDTANNARQYEARIAKLPAMAETIQTKTKQRLLQQPYNVAAGTAELQQARQRIAKIVSLPPDPYDPLHLDSYYLGDAKLQTNCISLQGTTTVSGHCIGMIGPTLIFQQDQLHYMFQLSKLRGYRVTITQNEVTNKHQPHQISLF